MNTPRRRGEGRGMNVKRVEGMCVCVSAPKICRVIMRTHDKSQTQESKRTRRRRNNSPMKGIHPTTGLSIATPPDVLPNPDPSKLLATDNFPVVVVDDIVIVGVICPTSPTLPPLTEVTAPTRSGLTNHGPYASTTFPWISLSLGHLPSPASSTTAFISLNVNPSNPDSLFQIFFCTSWGGVGYAVARPMRRPSIKATKVKRSLRL